MTAPSRQTAEPLTLKLLFRNVFYEITICFNFEITEIYTWLFPFSSVNNC